METIRDRLVHEVGYANAARLRNFETNPEEINWGHVGTLGRYASLLKQITDMAFNEGEHAE